MEQSRWAPKPVDEEDKNAGPSSLSAAAPSFSPAPAPPPDVSTIDSFSQSGGAEESLFNDVEPVTHSMRVRSEDDLFSEDFTPVTQPVVEQPPPRGPASRARGDGVRGRGRGRGRGTATQPRGDVATSRIPPTAPTDASKLTDTSSTPPINAPSGPKNSTLPSVRGDRFATGGVRKPKLTETELAEKMARISIKNASLTAAHARAEADAANFAEREAAAKQLSQQRQKEERRDRQQMMGEREKNRLRKLKAMEGREWDAEKNEEDFSKGGKFDKKGGAAFAGDQEDYTDGREYLYREPRAERGRGGRGGGRGGRGNAQAPPRQEDFPALSSGKKDDGITAGPGADANATQGKSWADQVESSTTAW